MPSSRTGAGRARRRLGRGAVARAGSFVDALGHCVALALAAGIAGEEALLDSGAFAVELERTVAAARWRSQSIAVAVFTVHGFELGPGRHRPARPDPACRRARALGRAPRRPRGPSRRRPFRAALPAGGEFEARAAFKRVRASLAGTSSSRAVCCAARRDSRRDGDHASGAELLADARERLSLARRRAYFPATRPTARGLRGRPLVSRLLLRSISQLDITGIIGRGRGGSRSRMRCSAGLLPGWSGAATALSSVSSALAGLLPLGLGLLAGRYGIAAAMWALLAAPAGLLLLLPRRP